MANMANINIDNIDYEYLTIDKLNEIYDIENRYEDLIEIQQENWG